MRPPEAVPQPETGRDSKFAAALDCYLSSLQDIAEAIRTISPEVGSAYYDQLIRLRKRLAFESSIKTLEESRTTLHQELKTFSEKARRFNQALADDVNQSLAVLANNEDNLFARNNRYIEQLSQLADQMDQLAKSGDKARLMAQATGFRHFVQSMQRDSSESFARLQQKMLESQNKLREAQLLGLTDPLTGVGNRREFDRELALRIDAKRGFCMLLFDLNHFKMVNDRHGHLYGDAILKQLGERLRRQIRPRDFVCRWGGDEFVVILECGLEDAEIRSGQIAQWLSGPYKVSLEGQEILVDIGVSVGLAEHVPGETPEQLFRRVDDSLYSRKNMHV